MNKTDLACIVIAESTPFIIGLFSALDEGDNFKLKYTYPFITGVLKGVQGTFHGESLYESRGLDDASTLTKYRLLGGLAELALTVGEYSLGLFIGYTLKQNM
tara:strand:- start:430 stop:735 length:306 start_codon:yes stop_codon:yes gene_type:complete